MAPSKDGPSHVARLNALLGRIGLASLIASLIAAGVGGISVIVGVPIAVAAGIEPPPKGPGTLAAISWLGFRAVAAAAAPVALLYLGAFLADRRAARRVRATSEWDEIDAR